MGSGYSCAVTHIIPFEGEPSRGEEVHKRERWGRGGVRRVGFAEGCFSPDLETPHWYKDS